MDFLSETQGFLPKVYETLWSEMPLAFTRPRNRRVHIIFNLFFICFFHMQHWCFHVCKQLVISCEDQFMQKQEQNKHDIFALHVICNWACLLLRIIQGITRFYRLLHENSLMCSMFISLLSKDSL